MGHGRKNTGAEFRRTTPMARKSGKKSGLAPGTLIFTGQKKAAAVTIGVFHYREDALTETAVTTPAGILPFLEMPGVTWVSITGLHDTAVIKSLGEVFDLHPLVLEDMLDTSHQPKMDDFDRYLFLVLKLFYLTGEAASLENEQISLVARPGLVISLEERPTDIFDPVRERLRKGMGRIRSRGSDYLTHALIDAVVDSYDSIFDRVGEKIDRLQDELLAAPRPATLQAILQLKRELLQLRKSIWPTREFVNALSRQPSPLIGSEVTLFLRDVYDHAVRTIDLLENDREMLSGMVDLYLSSSSQRLNEIMKVLTVISTLFIPLTFLAGVYGMNFRYMPELEWRWGYPLFWVLILVTGGGMLAWLRHKRWL